MHHIAKKMKLAVVAGGIACGLASASGAQASERTSAAACLLDPPYTGAFLWMNGGIANMSSGLGWSELWVHCPITTDDTLLPRQKINGLDLSIVDMDNQFGSDHNFHIIATLSPSFGGASAVPITSGNREFNPGTATGNFWQSVPSDVVTFLATGGINPWYSASLDVLIPANAGTPSVLRGLEIFRSP
jgi:hypothetical protein